MKREPTGSILWSGTIRIKAPQPPSFRDRLYFVIDHRRRTPLGVLWALLRGRATGIHIVGEHGSGTIFCNKGYAKRRVRK